MGRRDALAQGARKATYAVSGDAKATGKIELKNISAEGRDKKADAALQAGLDAAKKDSGPRKRFIPLGATILVRRKQAEDPSGLLLTENLEKEAPAEGTVLAVGPKSEVTVGDYVVFGKYAGAEFVLNKETLLLMESSEVKGTLVPETFSDDSPICTSIGRA
jgi:chaperonin GroES